jgi:hypothetical protein
MWCVLVGRGPHAAGVPTPLEFCSCTPPRLRFSELTWRLWCVSTREPLKISFVNECFFFFFCLGRLKFSGTFCPPPGLLVFMPWARDNFCSTSIWTPGSRRETNAAPLPERTDHEQVRAYRSGSLLLTSYRAIPWMLPAMHVLRRLCFTVSAFS